MADSRPPSTPDGPTTPDASSTGDGAVTHIHLLLDRSGSMEAIAHEVIDGFAGFLAAQRAEGDDAVMTLVQFDTVDPFEIVADAVPIAEMVPLDRRTFVPRGGTPLYDALGRLLGKATSRQKARAAAGLPAEHVVIAIYTDGLENASCEYTRQQVFDAITRHESEDGWTIVYLGAHPDAMAESESLGIDAGHALRYSANAEGTAVAFASLSTSLIAERREARAGRRRDAFFDTGADAESDTGTRSGTGTGSDAGSDAESDAGSDTDDLRNGRDGDGRDSG
ncbi:MAG: VWA domain-containing protein [Actinomyces sp.]|nr:MAG: VWA domain-containing protein [Actinomyces sp.]